MHTAEDASGSHQALIDELVAAGTVRGPAVEAALRAVSRHLFLPGVPLEVLGMLVAALALRASPLLHG